jgi:uncharacterized protein
MRAIFFDELTKAKDMVRQCDACMDNTFFVTKPTLIQDKPYQLNLFDTIEIKENSFVIFTSTAIAIVNQKAIDFLNQFSISKVIKRVNTQTEKFIKYGFLKTNDSKEIKPIENIERLTAWIHLTDSCNLRCSYCFLPHEPKTLSFDMGMKIIDSLIKTAQKSKIETLKLKYAGGEPLQNFKTLKLLHQYASKSDIEITASLLTNGVMLTPKILKWIKKENIKLVISLDSLNQSERLDKHGRETSSRVIKAIELSLLHGVNPSITITVNSKTIDTLPRLMEWILKNNLVFSINFYKGVEAIDTDKIINGMLDVFKIIEKNPPKHSLLNSLLDITDLSKPHLRGCSVGQNYLIFDTEGKISQCPMSMNQPISDIHSPQILKDIQNISNPIKNLSVETIEECRNCQWRYWCGSGCSIVSDNQKSPYCEVYKRLFPEVLKLESAKYI